LLILFLVQTFSVAGEGALKTISPKEASELIAKHKNNADFIILDVRTPREFKSGHIEKAILLDYYSKTYTDELKRLDKTKIRLRNKAKEYILQKFSNYFFHSRSFSIN